MRFRGHRDFSVIRTRDVERQAFRLRAFLRRRRLRLTGRGRRSGRLNGWSWRCRGSSGRGRGTFGDVLGFEQRFDSPQTLAEFIHFLAKLLNVGGLIRGRALCGLSKSDRREGRKKEREQSRCPPGNASRAP